MHSPTQYQDIVDQLDRIDPVRYGKSRNFIDGSITELSPFISRGVIDTKMIVEHLISKKYSYSNCEKFLQQLCWREYFQRVWQHLKEGINGDIKNQQTNVNHRATPSAIIKAQTSIDAIDDGIKQLISKGMMHNHLRMYTAFIACNVGKSHWLQPARWMYYHLLDGDWGSNALSWQWIAGTFSNKKYIANQENINHYTGSKQRGTYLDVSYDVLQELSTPAALLEIDASELHSNLPTSTSLQIDPTLPTLVYNYYNLSPTWRANEKANRIFLLEPDVFHQYPVSDECISFALELAKNIQGIQFFTGSFTHLKSHVNNQPIYYKEHPLNIHYEGLEDERSWIIPGAITPKGSFFSFWKKNEKKLKEMFSQSSV
jgi:deoxyribodipyrimidine photo-lyase